jgi:hypothetical protein
LCSSEPLRPLLLLGPLRQSRCDVCFSEPRGVRFENLRLHGTEHRSRNQGPDSRARRSSRTRTRGLGSTPARGAWLG